MCPSRNLPPCLHISLSYITCFDIKRTHQRFQSSFSPLPSWQLPMLIVRASIMSHTTSILYHRTSTERMCPSRNLPPCLHISLSYITGSDIKRTPHQRFQSSFSPLPIVDSACFHNITRYTDPLSPRIHGTHVLKSETSLLVFTHPSHISRVPTRNEPTKDANHRSHHYPLSIVRASTMSHATLIPSIPPPRDIREGGREGEGRRNLSKLVWTN